MNENSLSQGKTQADFIRDELNFDANLEDPVMKKNSDDHPTDDEWMDILGTGQLKKKIIKKGEDGMRPNKGEVCILKIIGKLEDGTTVEEYDNLIIQLGDMEVVQGLDLTIALMNVGEVAEIVVNPRFAYGKLGKEPDIPPDAVITYTVELKSSELETEIETLSIKERKEMGNKKRERGNWWFTRNEPTVAIQCYRRALEFLLPTKRNTNPNADEKEESVGDAELQDLLEDRMKVYNNLAVAQMKTEAYDMALESAENVLSCQPHNVKALFRKGKILHFKGEHAQAYTILLQAAKLEPESKVIQAELTILKGKNAKDVQHEKNLYRKMLGTDKNANNSSKNIQRKTKSKTDKILWSLIGGASATAIVSLLVYKFVS